MHAVRAKLDWFKATLLPHEAALRGRLRRVLPRRLDIDDIVSETMTRAYATEDYARVTAGRAYLFQIARNLLIDEARRAKVVSFDLIADLDLMGTGPSTEAALEARDALRRLQSVIDTLPIQCRRAYILRRVEGKSPVEIADEMGLSVSTVDKHIGRATVKVMQAIGQFEDFGLGQRAAAGRDRSNGRAPVSTRANH